MPNRLVSLFTCPNTKFMVQHCLPYDEEASEDDFEGIICQGCTRVHFVNRKGKVFGSEENPPQQSAISNK